MKLKPQGDSARRNPNSPIDFESLIASILPIVPNMRKADTRRESHKVFLENCFD